MESKSSYVVGGEVLVGLAGLPLEYAYEDCLRYCGVSDLNTSSQEEPDEFINPGVWIAQESLNFLWYINKIQSTLNGSIKNVSNQGKQELQAMPLSTQKTALNWPHIKQANLHQFKDGGMGP